MHGDPDIQRDFERIRQYRHQHRLARGQLHLARADAAAGADRGQYGEVGVGAQAEHAAIERYAARTNVAGESGFTVVADQAMLRQLVHGLRRAMPAQIVAMRVKAQLHLADMPGHQRPLRRPHHAHGDVRVAPQQVLHAIRQHQFDHQPRMRVLQLADDRRQHLAADDLAGGDAHRAAQVLTASRSGAQQRFAARFQRFRVRTQLRRRFGRRQAMQRTGEQGQAKRLLQRFHLPPHCRLRQAQGARGGGERAVAQHRQEGAVQGPVGFVLGHT